MKVTASVECDDYGVHKHLAVIECAHKFGQMMQEFEPGETNLDGALVEITFSVIPKSERT